MRFAFLIMGDFDSQTDRAIIHSGAAQIIGVSDIDDACRVAKQLSRDGIDSIELCGAFEEVGTRKIIEATENKVPIGFVGHLPEQDALFERTFGS